MKLLGGRLLWEELYNTRFIGSVLFLPSERPVEKDTCIKILVYRLYTRRNNKFIDLLEYHSEILF